MDFLTEAQLKQHYGVTRVEQLATESGAYDTDIVNELITTCSDEVEQELSSLYTATQLAASGAIRRATAVLVIYALQLRRGDVSSDVAAAEAKIRTLLDRLRRGETKLGAVDRVLPAELDEVAEVFEESGYFNGLHDEDLE